MNEWMGLTFSTSQRVAAKRDREDVVNHDGQTRRGTDK